MTNSDLTDAPRRYKVFDETHQSLIETAVRLVADRGIEALSLSALARAARVNRTTAYYHFQDRDGLIDAVRQWSSEQIVKAFRPDLPQPERIAYINRFVLENPEIMKLWIDEFISPGDIRDSYPRWDALVDGVRRKPERRLMNLMLSLAHISLSAEILGDEEPANLDLRQYMKITRSPADA